MAGKIVLVFVILAVTSTSWIEAAPADYDDYYDYYTSDVGPTSCGSNEYYTYSAAASQRTCQTPELFLTIRIGMPGCVCEQGYIRDSNWICVKKEDCSFI